MTVLSRTSLGDWNVLSDTRLDPTGLGEPVDRRSP